MVLIQYFQASHQLAVAAVLQTMLVLLVLVVLVVVRRGKHLFLEERGIRLTQAHHKVITVEADLMVELPHLAQAVVAELVPLAQMQHQM
jgi:hypothetical protein